MKTILSLNATSISEMERKCDGGVVFRKGLKKERINNMSKNDETLSRLFGDESIHFEIPEYQRAYSWEKEEWSQFIQDLKDATYGYYLGHFLFETDNDRLLVIDGQQRLTTCVIFVRSAIKVISTMANDEYEREIRIWRRRFLEDEDFGPRLKAVPFDNPVFQDCIVSDRAEPISFNTRSAKNLVEAKKYFISELLQIGDAKAIYALVERMGSAVITRYDVDDRAMAARVFAFQNDRGKDLTHLESIKAYLMLTVYMKGKTKQTKDTTIEVVDEQFARIYETIARINIDEDQVLSYYWKSRNGYHAGAAVEEVKKQLSSAADPVDWIRVFVRELADAFAFVEDFLANSGEYHVRLRLLNNMALSYPFLIRARLKGVKADSVVFERLLKVMENLTFRSLIRGGRADIQSRLDGHLLQIEDESSLLYEINQIVATVKSGGWNYWSDGELAQRLDEWFYGNRVDNYLLWQYELSLYSNGYKAPGRVTAKEMMANESIEHIAPQTPTNGGGDSIANGYGLYNGKDVPENGIESGGWMNRLGNLVLASQSQNSSLGNKPFSVKLDDYSQVILAQQTKIKNYAETNERGEILWTVNSIKLRQKDIVDWAKRNWDISNVLK